MPRFSQDRFEGLVTADQVILRDSTEMRNPQNSALELVLASGDHDAVLFSKLFWNAPVENQSGRNPNGGQCF